MELEEGMDILESIMADGPSVTITITTPRRNFRSPSEMRESHGHVEGVINLYPPPISNKTQRLELSLVPSEKSNSVEHMIHPNIPFLTIRETKKRGTKFNTDLTTPKAWKVTLIIQNGVVYYLDHDLKTKKRVDVLHNGNQIKLGRHHLEMTIITPLQTKHGLSVGNIIQNRVQYDNNSPNMGLNSPCLTDNIIKQFIGSQQAKDEMKRCRIRACLYQDETDNMKIAEAYSISICDTKNKSYGNFEISTMSKPWGCCSKGGWQTFLVSKTKVDKNGFWPIFVTCNNNQENAKPVEQSFKNFKQISKDSVQVVNNSVFIFEIPAQNPLVIECLKQFNEKVYMTIFRESDGEFASNMIKFDYDVHDENDEDCPYCAITHMKNYEGSTSSRIKRKPSKKGLFHLEIPNKKRNISTSGVSSISPGSPYELPVLSPDEVTDCFIVANNSESGDTIINDIITETGIIDLGLGEFQQPSNATVGSAFDLSFLDNDGGANAIVRDGPCKSYHANAKNDESDSITDDENDDDDDISEESETDTCHCSVSENSEEELEQLCSITNKLVM